MNTKLLRIVKAAILDNPTQVEMRSWYSTVNKTGERVRGCGTASCIAGWTVAIADGETLAAVAFQTGNLSRYPASSLLKLTPMEANRLFFVVKWPERFRRSYSHCRTQKGIARVVADRIEHFIKTKE